MRSLTENTVSHSKPFAVSGVHAGQLLASVTALWAFAETALGGILHALKIPFTGIFVGGAAIIFISLIGWLRPKPGVILRSTVIVVLVKLAVSPHAPFMASIAVLLQGLLGELYFSVVGSQKLAVYLLAFSAMLLSALQKLLVLTIIFGETFWESINIFGAYILTQFFIETKSSDVYVSEFLIILYLALHLIAAGVIGYFAAQLPGSLLKSGNRAKVDRLYKRYRNREEGAALPGKRKKKRSVIVYALILSVVMLAATYALPGFSDGIVEEMAVMLIRAVAVLFLLYALIGPLLSKGIKYLLRKKQHQYASDVTDIFERLVTIRKLAGFLWKETDALRGISRMKEFLSLLTLVVLLAPEEEHA